MYPTNWSCLSVGSRQERRREEEQTQGRKSQVQGKRLRHSCTRTRTQLYRHDVDKLLLNTHRNIIVVWKHMVGCPRTLDLDKSRRCAVCFRDLRHISYIRNTAGCWCPRGAAHRVYSAISHQTVRRNQTVLARVLQTKRRRDSWNSTVGRLAIFVAGEYKDTESAVSKQPARDRRQHRSDDLSSSHNKSKCAAAGPPDEPAGSHYLQLANQWRRNGGRRSSP